jgi:hypothetical protein
LPRRLTVLAIAGEALTTWTCVPQVFIADYEIDAA